MTNKAGEQPTITQADRDAAAAYWKVSMIGSSMTQKLYKSGEFDSSLIVQAFARHRTTSLAAQDGLVEALRAQHDAEMARNECEECEGEGDWVECSVCSLAFGNAIDLRHAALSALGDKP